MEPSENAILMVSNIIVMFKTIGCFVDIFVIFIALSLLIL